MTKVEILEEIRALLREPQVETVEEPYNYSDPELTTQIRSSLRHLRVHGLRVTAVMNEAGAFTTEPTELEGMLTIYFVADRLLGGDLVQKLIEGELGILWRSGGDLIDTKTATRAFESVAGKYRADFDRLLTIALTSQDGGANSTFGDQTAYAS